MPNSMVISIFLLIHPLSGCWGVFLKKSSCMEKYEIEFKYILPVLLSQMTNDFSGQCKRIIQKQIIIIENLIV